jgi:hypothetical protein
MPSATVFACSPAACRVCCSSLQDPKRTEADMKTVFDKLIDELTAAFDTLTD